MDDDTTMGRLLDSRLGRFVTIALAILLVAIPLSALFAPPDPYTQIVVAGGVLLIALSAANILSHPAVFERLREN